MRTTLQNTFNLLIISAIFCSCVTDNFEEDPQPFGEEVYFPIYGSIEDIEIKVLEEYPLTNPGKIYTFQNYLFVNEFRKGVHIIDNSSPESPAYVSFIKITGNVDIAVKGNILYADHAADLVSIDISNIKAPKVVGRVEDLYAQVTSRPPTPGYFKCPDRNKIDLIIGWEKRESSEKVNCYWYE